MLKESTEDAGTLYFALVSLAVAAGAIGLVFAREAYRNENYLSAIFGTAGWLIAVSVIALMEAGFWQAKQDVAGDALKVQGMAAQGRMTIASMQQNELESYADIKKSSQELTAEREALLAKEAVYGRTLAKVTDNCVKPGSFGDECNAVGTLAVNIARAQRKEELLREVWTHATGQQISIRTLDINAPSKVLASLTGSDLDTAKKRLITLLVAMLFLCRDVMLLIATAPRKHDDKPVPPHRPKSIIMKPEEYLSPEKIGDAVEPLMPLPRSQQIESKRSEPAPEVQQVEAKLAEVAPKSKTISEKSAEPATVSELDPQQVDPIQAKINELATKIASGINVSPAQAEKAIAAACDEAGLPRLTKKAITRRLNQASKKLAGPRITTTTGRTYGVVNTRKEVGATIGAAA
jgi:hypothetical protein